jgi:hypothetical protein
LSRQSRPPQPIRGPASNPARILRHRHAPHGHGLAHSHPSSSAPHALPLPPTAGAHTSPHHALLTRPVVQPLPPPRGTRAPVGPLLRWARCSIQWVARAPRHTWPFLPSPPRGEVAGEWRPVRSSVFLLLSLCSRAFVVFLLVAITPRSNPHTHTQKKPIPYSRAPIHHHALLHISCCAALSISRPGSPSGGRAECSAGNN